MKKFTFPLKQVITKSSVLLVLTMGCLMAGCGQDNSPKQSLLKPEIVKKFALATVLEGAVSNDKGLLKSGRVELRDNSGQMLVAAEVEANGHYQLQVPENTTLPIILTYQADDRAPEHDFLAVVIDPGVTHYPINPRTTAIAQKAKDLGGYTRANLVTAAEGMVHVPDANKTSTGFRGDPTTQYGGWH